MSFTLKRWSAWIMYYVKPVKQLINVHDLTDELKIYHYEDIMFQYANP